MLEDSGESGCNSKTSSNFGKNEDEAEEDNALSKFIKNGGSSSDSTVEESEKKPCVRPYVRSTMPRLRWTPDLHLRFVHAVERLGGQDRATPKLVLQMMNLKGLNIAHVKSHLQMYRSKKMEDQSQGIGHHNKLFMEGGNPNMFHLSQFPMYPTYYQRLNSTLMYEDASWIPSNTMGQSTLERTRRGLYTTLNQELGTRIPSFISGRSTLQTNETKDEMGLSKQNPSGEFNRLFHIVAKAQERAFGGNGSTSPQDMERAIDLQKQTPLKRKVSDCEVDLNLYLGVKPIRNGETTNYDDNDNGSSLSLSLSSPLSSSRATRFKQDANIDATTGFSQEVARIECQSCPTTVQGHNNNIDVARGFTQQVAKIESQSRPTPFWGHDSNIDATRGFTQQLTRIECLSRPTIVRGHDSNIDVARGFTQQVAKIEHQSRPTPVRGHGSNIDVARGFTQQVAKIEHQSRPTPVRGHDSNIDVARGFTQQVAKIENQSRPTPVWEHDSNIDVARGFTQQVARIEHQSCPSGVSGHDRNIDVTRGFIQQIARIESQSHPTPVWGHDSNIDVTGGFTQKVTRSESQSRSTPLWGHDSNIDATTENAKRGASTLDLTM